MSMLERLAALRALVLVAPAAAVRRKRRSSASRSRRPISRPGTSASARTAPACRPARARRQQGEAVYAAKCQACHGEKGAGRPNDQLVGGIGTIAPDKPPVKTVGSYWPYATTLFDYVRRAMPFNEPKSLTDDEVYAVSAYILDLNGIIGADDVLDAQSLPKVKMPNRDGFIPFPRQ